MNKRVHIKYHIDFLNDSDTTVVHVAIIWVNGNKVVTLMNESKTELTKYAEILVKNL